MRQRRSRSERVETGLRETAGDQVAPPYRNKSGHGGREPLGHSSADALDAPAHEPIAARAAQSNSRSASGSWNARKAAPAAEGCSCILLDDASLYEIRRYKSIGSAASPFLAPCLRARLGPLLPALRAFAAARRDDVDEIIAAVAVGDFVAGFDGLDGAQEDLVADPVRLGIRPARMIGVAAEVPAGRSVDRPPAVDLVEIAVAARLQLVGLRGRELAAFVFDDKGTLFDQRGCKEAEPGAGAADTKRRLAGHAGTSTTIRA